MYNNAAIYTAVSGTYRAAQRQTANAPNDPDILSLHVCACACVCV